VFKNDLVFFLVDTDRWKTQKVKNCLARRLSGVSFLLDIGASAINMEVYRQFFSFVSRFALLKALHFLSGSLECWIVGSHPNI